MKKLLALVLAAAMSASLVACGNSNAPASDSAAADSAPASDSAAADSAASDSAAAPAASGEGISISWWGGDSRHEAYQAAVAAFTEKTGIPVEVSYGAWSGWEETQSANLIAGNGADVMQVNWNWLYQYSGEGQSFRDLNDYADIIDLTQFPQSALDACVVAGELQAIPVAMTGRTFFWNMNTFKQAGIEAAPTTLDELLAAGKTFQEKLGDDYYPLCVGPYDRMIMMTFYLESVYGKAWVENKTCNYTVEEITEGMNFIKSLEDNHVVPTMEAYYGAGFDSIDKSTQWIEGKYAGIWEWDSSANKYYDALSDNSGFTVGQEIKYGDKANGGFAKVSMGLAITESCKNPEAAAQLINFLLNEEEGASIMGTECGMVSSKAGQAAAEAAGKIKPLVKEANDIVMAFVDFQLDPDYESNKLKGSDGYYTDAFDGFSYGDYTAEEAAQVLLDGVNEVLAG